MFEKYNKTEYLYGKYFFQYFVVIIPIFSCNLKLFPVVKWKAKILVVQIPQGQTAKG